MTTQIEVWDHKKFGGTLPPNASRGYGPASIEAMLRSERLM